MAIQSHNGIPVGPWRTDVKTNHWLHIDTIASYDDMSGNERVLMLTHIRETIQTAVSQLQEHHIEIANAQCAEMYDSRSFESVYKVAIGFSCREDLVMAKLVLKCNEYDL